LVTPAFTFLSLVFNLGTLLLFHGGDPNFVTTKWNLQRSIQTIESMATEGWSTIATYYRDLFSPLSASSASSCSFIDRAEWIYRSYAVRILRSLDGSVSHSSRTQSLPLSSLALPSAPLSISTDIALYPSTDITLDNFDISFYTSADIVPYTPTDIIPHTSTDIILYTSTDIILYTPLPPTSSISNAPFVVDYVEHPWETPGVIEMNFPRFWSIVLYILVSLATYVWFEVVRSPLVFSSNSPPQFQAHHPTDALDVEVEPTYEAHNIDSTSASNLNSGLGTNSKPQVPTTTVDIPSVPRSLPVVVTTSDGQVLFCAEIALSSNQIISTTSSSVKFSVDVVAFRNLSPCKSRFLVPLPNSPFQQPSKTSTPPRTATTVLTPKYPPLSATANLIS
jgi:hypothetical protein